VDPEPVTKLAGADGCGARSEKLHRPIFRSDADRRRHDKFRQPQHRASRASNKYRLTVFRLIPSWCAIRARRPLERLPDVAGLRLPPRPRSVGFLPLSWPPGAGTAAESKAVRSQSMRSAWASSSSSIWCERRQTPALYQSRSLRQHVIPLPQPISAGKYSQGIPVFSTNRIPSAPPGPTHGAARPSVSALPAG
jgi:hypothetical protein